MNLTHKTDDSFFSCITLVSGAFLYTEAIVDWFKKDPVGQWRIIEDPEVREEKLNLKSISEIFPGIKTFSVVINPWANIYFGYKLLQSPYKQVLMPTDTDYSNLTFEDFVNQLHTWEQPSTSNWYKPTTQQMEWLSFTDESNNYIEADYIFKIETIEEDFKVLQDYFCSIEPLTPRDNFFIDLRSIEYRSVYNTETQNIVKKLFEKDIDRFEYTF
jgi:hypothetical protein